MSKNKDTVESLRQKLHEKQIELKTEKAQEEIKEKLNRVAYDIFQDPDKKGRAFLMSKIRYNPETGDAKVLETRPFEDKATGLSFQMNQDNLEYLFNKCKKKGK